jgi:GH24 family phage-related lysozyme (muramidase)
MISQKSIDLIIESEGCDLIPNWPGGASGVTYGYGFDLGYNSEEQIKRDWAAHVNGNVLAFMVSCAGVKGETAKKRITTQTRVLKITSDAAREVFENRTLPRFIKLAQDTYPGFDELNEDTRGAIVSLVFNRGSSFGVQGQASWESRREMRELAPLILAKDYEGIAAKIKEMSRLWTGKGLDGLIARRHNEAALCIA